MGRVGNRISMKKRTWLVRPFALALLLVAFRAQAEEATVVDDTTRATLRQLGRDGVQAYQDGDDETAVDLLERAWGILPNAPSGLWLGRALERSGRLVEASERYLAATRVELDRDGNIATQKAARVEARSAYEAIQPRIPRVKIRIAGAEIEEIELGVAGKTVPHEFLGTLIPVNPGQVNIVARLGDTLQRRRVELAEGQELELTFDFGSPRSPLRRSETSATESSSEEGPRGASTQSTLGWIGVGIGGAGLLAGGVSGALAWSQYGQFDCPTHDNCDEDSNKIKTYNTRRSVSMAGFIAGGVVLAGGLALVLSAPRSSSDTHIAARLGWRSLFVSGTF